MVYKHNEYFSAIRRKKEKEEKKKDKKERGAVHLQQHYGDDGHRAK
jgi:hypothetical protein